MGIFENVREVLRGLKRRGPVRKLCPRCGSPELRLSSKFDIWLTPEQYICKSCGYKGPIVMEVEEEETSEEEK
jgi:predicted RNA-binding Zn-ribbon protein involved in translation (DUF1610 family)